MRQFMRIYDNKSRLIAIDYLDGNSIEYKYDDEGNLKGVVDTASGMSIHLNSVGWFKVRQDGSVTMIDGNISLNQLTGELTLNSTDGSIVITSPDGSVHRSHRNNIA